MQVHSFHRRRKRCGKVLKPRVVLPPNEIASSLICTGSSSLQYPTKGLMPPLQGKACKLSSSLILAIGTTRYQLFLPQKKVGEAVKQTENLSLIPRPPLSPGVVTDTAVHFFWRVLVHCQNCPLVLFQHRHCLSASLQSISQWLAGEAFFAFQQLAM